MAQPVTNRDILNYLIDLSANIAHQFAIVESQNSSIFATVTGIEGYLEDLSANIAVQFSYVANEIENSNLEINNQFGVVNEKISQQTNDINTNTNTALSQYTNTINTNTNESVSTAVSILSEQHANMK